PLTLAPYEAREVGVEQIGHGVVLGAAHRAAVGLHHGQTGSPVVPIAVTLHACRYLGIAKERVRHLAQHLPTRQVVGQVDAFGHARGYEDGRLVGVEVPVEGVLTSGGIEVRDDAMPLVAGD